MNVKEKEWYVVFLGAVDERKIETYSDDNTWIPRYKERKFIRKTFKECQKPIYPGYVFISDPSFFTLIKRYYHHVTLLGEEGKPYKLSDEDVNNVLEAQRLLDSHEYNIKNFKVGEIIEIIEGPFAGFRAKVKAIYKNGIIEYKLPLLGRTVDMKTDMFKVRCID